MPSDFGDAKSEYDSALSSAAIFDFSHAGKLEVTGPEAPDFLHNLCTNDVKGMPLGAGCEAFFCNVRARALFHTRIYHVKPSGRDALWIDVTPGYEVTLFQHLDRHLIAEQVELANRTDQFAQMHLAGPAAAMILATALGQPIPELELHQHMERTFGSGAVAHIRRHDPLGLLGFDLVCLNARAGEVWDLLVGAGARPAGLQAWEWLRIEAGTPVFGKDIDENRFVIEIGRDDAISYTKGCYLGQEPIVMARDRAGFVNRSFRGMRLSSSDVTAGAKLFGTDEIGHITSVVTTPGQGPIALGYVRRGSEKPGTVLRVGSADSQISATIADFPLRTP